MEIHFSPELEAKLADVAAVQGRTPDEFVQEVVGQHFEETARYAEAIRRGEEALDRGEYLRHEDVEKRLSRFLQV